MVQYEIFVKIFLIWSSGNPFVRRSGTICAILEEGIIRNNSVNLFRIWASGSGGDIVKKISNQELRWPSCSVERKHLFSFERRHHWEHSYEVV